MYRLGPKATKGLPAAHLPEGAYKKGSLAGSGLGTVTFGGRGQRKGERTVRSVPLRPEWGPRKERATDTRGRGSSHSTRAGKAGLGRTP